MGTTLEYVWKGGGPGSPQPAHAGEGVGSPRCVRGHGHEGARVASAHREESHQGWRRHSPRLGRSFHLCVGRLGLFGPVHRSIRSSVGRVGRVGLRCCVFDRFLKFTFISYLPDSAWIEMKVKFDHMFPIGSDMESMRIRRTSQLSDMRIRSDPIGSDHGSDDAPIDRSPNRPIDRSTDRWADRPIDRPTRRPGRPSG